MNIAGLRICAIRLGWRVLQINQGDLPKHIKEKIAEGVKAAKDGRVVSLEDVKKKYNNT